jgi:hypothetical protein
MNDQTKRTNLDLDDLLHPAKAFLHPSEVVRDPDLTLNEKRAILASWASDACAVEAAPSLRKTPDGKTVSFDDVMDALRELDKEVRQDRSPHWRRVIRRTRMLGRGRGGHEQGSPLQ